jgi:hypothetical protein
MFLRSKVISNVVNLFVLNLTFFSELFHISFLEAINFEFEHGDEWFLLIFRPPTVAPVFCHSFFFLTYGRMYLKKKKRDLW